MAARGRPARGGAAAALRVAAAAAAAARGVAAAAAAAAIPAPAVVPAIRLPPLTALERSVCWYWFYGKRSKATLFC